MTEMERVEVTTGNNRGDQNLKPRKRWPSWQQWRQLFQTLNAKERFQSVAGAFLVIVSLLAWFITDLFFNQHLAPDFGGSFSEAVVGQPQFINPLLAPLNAVDQDLSQIVYSGLLKFSEQNRLEPDLAERYEISEDGKIYTVLIKEQALWHDGQRVTADDVLFTVNTLKNPEVKSPLRSFWQDVQAEKLDGRTVRFRLENPSVSFLNNLTLGILPAHIWSEVSTRNFGLAEPNLNPVGSGPYRFEKLEKDGAGFVRSVSLADNKQFYRQPPYIERLSVKFFDTEREALTAWNRGEVDALGNVSSKDLDFAEKQGNRKLVSVKLPRLFAIFFNQTQSRTLADKKVRLALAYATNKKEIARQMAADSVQAVSGPFPLLGTEELRPFDLAEAERILTEAGWELATDTDLIRKKRLSSSEDPALLTIKLTLPEVEELKLVAQTIKRQWEKVGAGVELNFVDLNAIQSQIIKPRNYEALLFGISLGTELDPYAFWHSSQKRDPGLNLALYDNSDVDEMLEKLRTITDESEQQEILKNISQRVQDDAPAIFLYNPYYLYLTNGKARGFNAKVLTAPHQRFADVEKWYIETKRVRR